LGLERFLLGVFALSVIGREDCVCGFWLDPMGDGQPNLYRRRHSSRTGGGGMAEGRPAQWQPPPLLHAEKTHIPLGAALPPSPSLSFLCWMSRISNRRGKKVPPKPQKRGSNGIEEGGGGGVVSGEDPEKSGKAPK
jgi:hypothetical protein